MKLMIDLFSTDYGLMSLGVIVFILHGLAPQIPMRTIYRGVAPLIFADRLLLSLLAAFPGLALWLPRLLST